MYLNPGHVILPAAEKVVQQVSHSCPATAPERLDVESIESTFTVETAAAAAIGEGDGDGEGGRENGVIFSEKAGLNLRARSGWTPAHTCTLAKTN